MGNESPALWRKRGLETSPVSVLLIPDVLLSASAEKETKREAGSTEEDVSLLTPTSSLFPQFSATNSFREECSSEAKQQLHRETTPTSTKFDGEPPPLIRSKRKTTSTKSMELASNEKNTDFVDELDFSSRSSSDATPLSRMNSLNETKLLFTTTLRRQKSNSLPSNFRFEGHFRYERQLSCTTNAEVWLVAGIETNESFVIKKRQRPL